MGITYACILVLLAQAMSRAWACNRRSDCSSEQITKLGRVSSVAWKRGTFIPALNDVSHLYLTFTHEQKYFPVNDITRRYPMLGEITLAWHHFLDVENGSSIMPLQSMKSVKALNINKVPTWLSSMAPCLHRLEWLTHEDMLIGNVYWSRLRQLTIIGPALTDLTGLTIVGDCNLRDVSLTFLSIKYLPWDLLTKCKGIKKLELITPNLSIPNDALLTNHYELRSLTVSFLDFKSNTTLSEAFCNNFELLPCFLTWLRVTSHKPFFNNMIGSRMIVKRLQLIRQAGKNLDYTYDHGVIDLGLNLDLELIDFKNCCPVLASTVYWPLLPSATGIVFDGCHCVNMSVLQYLNVRVTRHVKFVSCNLHDKSVIVSPDWHELQLLNVSHNIYNFTTLDFVNMPRLKKADLRYNRFEKLTLLMHSQNTVERILLDHNLLYHIEILGHNALTTLSLQDNRLLTISQLLVISGSITLLDIRRNILDDPSFLEAHSPIIGVIDVDITPSWCHCKNLIAIERAVSLGVVTRAGDCLRKIDKYCAWYAFTPNPTSKEPQTTSAPATTPDPVTRDLDALEVLKTNKSISDLFDW